MPIDKRQSHNNIVKELLDEYKSSGKIGNTTPKDAEHARRIANAIAYKVKGESTLNEIKKINAEASRQLSFDFQKNLNAYITEISQKNKQEIEDLVNYFMRAYLAIQRNRLKFFKKPIDLPKFKYDSSCIKLELIAENLKIPIGYSQYLGALDAASAQKAVKSTNHFHCRMKDSYLIVDITPEYKADIYMTIKELSE